jgi:hypothetical protein
MSGDLEFVKLPPVLIEFIVDDEQGLRLAKSEQNWHRPADGATVKTDLWLPVCDGFDTMSGGNIEILMPDGAAKRYMIKVMNMKAKRMIANGFKPRLKTHLESALMDFSTPIDKNGKDVNA